jgi:metal-responsive CopG/Arc/MetJ family transcriptional regulator
MKTAVSIPDPLFRAADRLARKLKVSRSRLYSVALERYVHANDDAAVTAKLDEVYSSEASNLDTVLQSIQARSIAKSEWK